jgi:hypothetical protein
MREQLLEQAETIVMPIIGYRVWGVENVCELRSHSWNVHWPIHQKITAACRTGLGACQLIAANGDRSGIQHQCGIYAFKTETQLDAYLREVDEKSHHFPSGMYSDRHDLVLGSVYLWGNVIECSDGYRAECAYPKEVFQSAWSAITRNRLEKIAELYGISCAWREEDFERLIA